MERFNMGERIKKNIEYIGYDKPSTPMEVDFEIAGLQLVILRAKVLIQTLEQSKLLAQIELEKLKNK